MIELKYRALSSADELDGFECGIEKMDTFIHSSSFFKTLREYDCDAYIVILDNQVVGLFAINMDVLDLDDDDKNDFIEMNPNGLFMTVDALNLSDGSYSAVKFYEHFNFQRLLPPRQDTIRMYCTMR